MSYIVQYFEWFAGFGLFALVLANEKVAISILQSIQDIAVKVTDLGVKRASS